jgi:hypothetical protein
MCSFGQNHLPYWASDGKSRWQNLPPGAVKVEVAHRQVQAAHGGDRLGASAPCQVQSKQTQVQGVIMKGMFELGLRTASLTRWEWGEGFLGKGTNVGKSERCQSVCRGCLCRWQGADGRGWEGYNFWGLLGRPRRQTVPTDHIRWPMSPGQASGTFVLAASRKQTLNLKRLFPQDPRSSSSSHHQHCRDLSVFPHMQYRRAGWSPKDYRDGTGAKPTG